MSSEEKAEYMTKKIFDVARTSKDERLKNMAVDLYNRDKEIRYDLKDNESSINFGYANEDNRTIQLSEKILSDVFEQGGFTGDILARGTSTAGRESWLIDKHRQIDPMMSQAGGQNGEYGAMAAAYAETFINNQLEKTASKVQVGMLQDLAEMGLKLDMDNDRSKMMYGALVYSMRNGESGNLDYSSGRALSYTYEMMKGFGGLGLSYFRNISSPIDRDSLTLTCGFGERKDPVKNSTNTSWQIHQGIDIGMPDGTRIYSILPDGQVAGIKNTCEAGDLACGGGFGNYVNVVYQTPIGRLMAQYNHLLSTDVSKGDHIDQNEQVGLSGNTGYSSGSHLDFKLSSSGKPNFYMSTFITASGGDPDKDIYYDPDKGRTYYNPVFFFQTNPDITLTGRTQSVYRDDYRVPVSNIPYRFKSRINPFIYDRDKSLFSLF